MKDNNVADSPAILAQNATYNELARQEYYAHKTGLLVLISNNGLPRSLTNYRPLDRWLTEWGSLQLFALNLEQCSKYLGGGVASSPRSSLGQ